MHRVELKEEIRSLKSIKYVLFLMHRVELKDLPEVHVFPLG